MVFACTGLTCQLGVVWVFMGALDIVDSDVGLLEGAEGGSGCFSGSLGVFWPSGSVDSVLVAKDSQWLFWACNTIFGALDASLVLVFVLMVVVLDVAVVDSETGKCWLGVVGNDMAVVSCDSTCSTLPFRVFLGAVFMMWVWGDGLRGSLSGC